MFFLKLILFYCRQFFWSAFEILFQFRICQTFWNLIFKHSHVLIFLFPLKIWKTQNLEDRFGDLEEQFSPVI